MGTIRKTLDSGGRATNTTVFIQCINDWEPQIHKLWCVVLDRICREIHPTACVDIAYHLAKNVCQILNIGQLSVNDSVQFLGLSDQSWGSGLLFIANLLAQVKYAGWGSANNSNQIHGVRFNNANSIENVAWGASIYSCPAYLPQSPVNPCATWRRIHNDFLHCRCQEHLRLQ